jgi:hypothetical protein
MSEIAKLAALLRGTVTAINNGRCVSDEAADNLEKQEAEIDRLRAELAALMEAAAPFAGDGDILPGHWDAISRAVRKARTVGGMED